MGTKMLWIMFLFISSTTGLLFNSNRMKPSVKTSLSVSLSHTAAVNSTLMKEFKGMLINRILNKAPLIVVLCYILYRIR